MLRTEIWLFLLSPSPSRLSPIFPFPVANKPAHCAARLSTPSHSLTRSTRYSVLTPLATIPSPQSSRLTTRYYVLPRAIALKTARQPVK